MAGEGTTDMTADETTALRYRREVGEQSERRATRPERVRDVLALPLDMRTIYSIGDLLQHLRPLVNEASSRQLLGGEPHLLVRGLHVLPDSDGGRVRLVQDSAGPHQYDVLAAAFAFLPGFDSIEVEEREVTLRAEGQGLRVLSALAEAPTPIVAALVVPEPRIDEHLSAVPAPHGAITLDSDLLSTAEFSRAALDAVGAVRGRPVTLAITGGRGEEALAFLHRDLVTTGLRDRVLLHLASEHISGTDVLVSAALGADRMTAGTDLRGPLLSDVRGQLAEWGLTSLARARGCTDLLHVLSHPAFHHDAHTAEHQSA